MQVPSEAKMIAERLADTYKGSRADWERYMNVAMLIYLDLKTDGKLCKCD